MSAAHILPRLMRKSAPSIVSNLKLSASAFVNPLQSLFGILRTAPEGSAAATRQRTDAVDRRDRRLVEHDASNRAVAEMFIAARFRECFGATIDAFMPRLFTLRNANGEIAGAFGLRTTTSCLFVEQYLNEPIERAIASHVSRGVERRSIVEVGHFSGAYPGAMRAMIVLLTAYLDREGFEWVVFTGTTSLRNAFARIGLAPLHLQDATAAGLSRDARASWGHYYEHAPQVLAGRIKDGFKASTIREARA